jgi:hypothetical protein
VVENRFELGLFQNRRDQLFQIAPLSFCEREQHAVSATAEVEPRMLFCLGLVGRSEAKKCTPSQIWPASSWRSPLRNMLSDDDLDVRIWGCGRSVRSEKLRRYRLFVGWWMTLSQGVAKK